MLNRRQYIRASKRLTKASRKLLEASESSGLPREDRRALNLMVKSVDLIHANLINRYARERGSDL